MQYHLHKHPQNEILRYKSNKIYIQFIWGKLQTSDEQNYQEINREIVHVCRWENSYYQDVNSSQIEL